MTHSAPPTRRILLVVLGLALGAGTYFVVRRGNSGAGPDDPGITLARERTAAFVQRDERQRAREALAPLVARSDAEFRDLVSAAAIEFADNQIAAAERFLDRAESASPGSAAVKFLRGQIAREAGETEHALELLRAAHEAEPRDLPTTIVLAALLDELDRPRESEDLYRAVVAVGFENGQQWYVSAVNRLANLLLQSPGREADAEPFVSVRRDLERRGAKPPSTLQMLLGEFGRVKPPAPTGSRVPEMPAPRFQLAPMRIPELALAEGLLATDLDHDGIQDLLAYGPRGVFAALRRGATFEARVIASEAAALAVPFDADNDGDLDVLVVGAPNPAERASPTWLLECRAENWSRTSVALPTSPGTITGVVASDYDHEGDLDLVLATRHGARVWRRDGTADLAGQPGGAVYTDASAESGFPSEGVFEACVAEDFDGDNDVDFLFAHAAGWALYDSLRGGRFAAAPAAFQGIASGPAIVADFDGDARPDLWIAGRPSTFAPRRGAARATLAAGVREARALATADFDLDGSLDVAWLDADGSVRGILALGLSAERELPPLAVPGARGPLAAGDFDQDGRVDLVVSGADGAIVLSNAGPTGRGVTLSLASPRETSRDNARGVGAVVELRAGSIYRRTYWRGEPTRLGLGDETRIDVLRVTWPNGVGVTDLDLDPAARKDDGTSLFQDMLQPTGQVGSCPFLYAWNGRTYGFVTDVLGITPLGLPIQPGVFVPPDHDEYVLVGADELVPRDGMCELQLTEELREVTYLDHARLVAVDHPRATEIFPNERFTFPPFPEPHVHTVRDALAPSLATLSDGREVTARVRAIDDAVVAAPRLQPAQFAGLAEPWFVELDFDRERVRDARTLRLLCTGWLFWPDASANLASARNPGTPFVPPILQVPDGRGGWRDAGPPVGFPAGKTKTMVIDVSAILRRDDPRIRVFTTLRLHWDALRLAVDDDDAPIETRAVACSSARLWRRGFSAPLDARVGPGMAADDDRPERFDWNTLAREPRWNPHPGAYTRLGECAELVTAVDDRFVILGAGDALTLRFDVSGLPDPRPGDRRDWLVYLDGWAKDRDPNTVEALEVEPLPFHGMSGYPYGPDERFPDDAQHAAWRAQWNTRAPWPWIRPVSPARESEWLLSVPSRP